MPSPARHNRSTLASRTVGASVSACEAIGFESRGFRSTASTVDARSVPRFSTVAPLRSVDRHVPPYRWAHRVDGAVPAELPFAWRLAATAAATGRRTGPCVGVAGEETAGQGNCPGRAHPSGKSKALGGRYGIRTHGDPEATTAFEAAPFVRSGNLPGSTLPEGPRRPESRSGTYALCLAGGRAGDEALVKGPSDRRSAAGRITPRAAPMGRARRTGGRRSGPRHPAVR
jgi:hypothetical protein